MAATADFTLFLPVGRNAAPVAPGAQRAGLAFAAVLGQVAVSRGATVTTARLPLPALADPGKGYGGPQMLAGTTLQASAKPLTSSAQMIAATTAPFAGMPALPQPDARVAAMVAAPAPMVAKQAIAAGPAAPLPSGTRTTQAVAKPSPETAAAPSVADVVVAPVAAEPVVQPRIASPSVPVTGLVMATLPSISVVPAVAPSSIEASARDVVSKPLPTGAGAPETPAAQVSTALTTPSSRPAPAAVTITYSPKLVKPRMTVASDTPAEAPAPTASPLQANIPSPISAVPDQAPRATVFVATLRPPASVPVATPTLAPAPASAVQPPPAAPAPSTVRAILVKAGAKASPATLPRHAVLKADTPPAAIRPPTTLAASQFVADTRTTTGADAAVAAPRLRGQSIPPVAGLAPTVLSAATTTAPIVQAAAPVAAPLAAASRAKAPIATAGIVTSQVAIQAAQPPLQTLHARPIVAADHSPPVTRAADSPPAAPATIATNDAPAQASNGEAPRPAPLPVSHPQQAFVPQDDMAAIPAPAVSAAPVPRATPGAPPTPAMAAAAFQPGAIFDSTPAPSPAVTTPVVPTIAKTRGVANDLAVPAAPQPPALPTAQPQAAPVLAAAPPPHASDQTAVKAAKPARDAVTNTSAPAPAPVPAGALPTQPETPSVVPALRDAGILPAEPDKVASALRPDAAAAPIAAPAAAATATTQPATATPDQPPAASAQAPPQPPAAQLATAVASLHLGADGTSHTTIRLDPAELGHLQIRISRATDGTATVDVSVERPDTLATLQNDLGHLHQALDRAGLPDQRSVTMHLSSQPDQGGGTMLGSGTGTGNGPNTGFGQQGGSQHGARQPPQAAGQPRPASPVLADSLPTRASRAAASAGAGVNITA